MNQKKHPNVVILEKAVSFLGPMINEMVFIGGGAGMAPMRSHIFD